ncbi:MAG TPA: hypothetical protein VHZ33_12275 [Trebonia sp.]|jgi:hypothetical protein|nr:hypothetical protein [Trebonia sp.]
MSYPDAPLAAPARTSEAASRSGGPEGNERLTAITGAVLLILLAVEGYTILRIGRLLTLHVFLGMLLLGPVTLKAGSVLYRFARYYTGSAPYQRKGPPAPLLRVIGPINMLLTACVFGTGIMLAVTGPNNYDGGPTGWLELHRLSFIGWLFFMAIHVLAYVWRLPRLLAGEARGASSSGPDGESGGAGGSGSAPRSAGRQAVEVLGGRGTRLALLVASLLAGLVIALLTVHLTGKWEPIG